MKQFGNVYVCINIRQNLYYLNDNVICKKLKTDLENANTIYAAGKNNAFPKDQFGKKTNCILTYL